MDGDWICPECNEHNFARRWICFRCNAPRESTASTTSAMITDPPETTTVKKQSDTDWKCVTCNTSNLARRELCFICGAAKNGIPETSLLGSQVYHKLYSPLPQLSTTVANAAAAQQLSQLSTSSNPSTTTASSGGTQMLKGDWLCSTCKEHNFARRKTCFGCGTPRLSYSTPTQFQEGDWVCKRCDEHNYARRSNCFVCGCTKEGYPPDWRCPGCGENNFARRIYCFHCQAPKPQQTQQQETQTTPPAIRTSQLSGDWICPKCNEHNFARRYVCFGCQESRPENAPQPQTTSEWSQYYSSQQNQTPVMNGDWFCPSCSAHNFARRMTCYSCQVPRERTSSGTSSSTKTKQQP